MGFIDAVKSVGRYQWILVVFYFVCHLPGAWINQGILVMAPDVPFHCSDYHNNDTSQQCFINTTNIINSSTNNNNNVQSDYIDYTDNTTSVKCQNFTYDHSKFQWTLTEKFNLVCDRKYLIAISKSVFLAGYFIGALGSGISADKIGRKRTMLICTVVCIVLSIASAAINDLTVYLILRFTFAAFEMGMWLTSLILVTEFLKKEERTLPIFIGSFGYDIMIFSFGVLSMIMSNYQILHVIVACILVVILLVILFFVEESPRWLYTQNKELRAKAVVQRIAEFNDSGVEHLSHLIQVCQKESSSVLDLFRTPLIRKRTLILFLIWFIYVMSAYSISYNLGEFSDDVRISLMITGSSELLTIIPTFFLMRKFGRPAVGFGLLISAGIICFSMAPLVGDKTNPLLMALCICGVVCMDNVFLVMYLYTPELYATTIRVTGLGACSTVARIVAVLAPEIVLLNQIWPPFMVVLLGFLTIFTAFLLPLLPDMTNIELVQTVEENENLFPRHKYSLRKAKPPADVHYDFSWIRI